MATGLLEDTVAGIDQDQRDVRGGGTRDHVARVLNVAGGVGDDELALRRREVAVGHVDRDALLPLGPQAVGEQREVGALETPSSARGLDGAELVLEDRLAVIQQTADEGGLAVVDASGGGDTQQLRHQK